jgi:hypothetical protein
VELEAGERADERDASDEEESNESNGNQERAYEREAEADASREDNPAAPLPRRCRRLDRAARQPCKLGHGHKPERPCPQAWNQHLERRDRLAAVPAAVVEHDDPARCPLRARATDDPRHALTAPVLRVVIRQHDEIALSGERSEVVLRVSGNSVRGCRVRGPHEPRVASGDPDEDRLGQVELEAALPGGAVRKSDVREGVVAELVAVTGEPANEIGMTRSFAADEEERARDVLATQDRRDLRRPARVGAVVEGESDPPARRRLGRDQPRTARAQDRPAVCERCGSAEHLVRLRARADGVGRETLEEHRDEDDQEAEREQAPVRGRAQA